MHTPYIFPSEHGHRTDVRVLEVSDGSGNTLVVTPAGKPRLDCVLRRIVALSALACASHGLIAREWLNRVAARPAPLGYRLPARCWRVSVC
jgi:hypothetical protein